MIELLRGSRWVRAGGLFSARSFNSLVALFFSLFAGRLLTVQDFGTFSRAMAAAVVVQACLEIGLQYSLVRFLTPALRDDGDEARAMMRASLFLKGMAFAGAGAVTALFFALGWSAGFLVPIGLPEELFPDMGPDQVTMVLFVVLGGAGLSVLSYLDAVLVARGEYIRLSFWIPSTGVLRLGLLFIFGFLDGGVRSEHVIGAFTLGTVVSVGVYFLISPPGFFFEPAPPERWKPWVRKLAFYNVWIVAAAFLSILSDWMEVFLLRSSGDAGIYNAARMPMQGFTILLATMQSFLLPRFSLLNGPAEFGTFFRRLYSVLLPGTLLFLPLFLVGPWFISIWYGPGYLASARVFHVLLPGFLLRMAFAPLGTALFAMDRPRLIMVEAALRVGGGMLLNLILIPVFGVVGAAWANSLGQLPGWIFLVVVFRRYLASGGPPEKNNDRPAPDGTLVS